MKIVRASGSPRRKELLSYITEDFIVDASDIEEIVPKNIGAIGVSDYLARKKAESVAKKYDADCLIIGCDTSVILDDEIMGKPSDEKQCREYLEKLSGKMHLVNTGCCLIMNNFCFSFTETTEVYFRKLTDEEISDYIATGEPFDKAGGYGIQGKGSLLVEKINGDYFNVVGLPISRLNLKIKSFMEGKYRNGRKYKK